MSHQLIPAGEYPPLLPPARAREALKALRSKEALANAARVIAMRTAELRGAVLELIGEMETTARAGDWSELFDSAHEIRGLAGTAGLMATGRIANGLCHYLDALFLFGMQPDAIVIALHVDAVARSARTEDETARHGDRVVAELSALVMRKLAELKDSETNGG